MSEWERKKFWMWAVTLMLWAVTLVIAIYFAIDYRRGKDAALQKMDKGIENSSKLVAIAEKGLAKIEVLEGRFGDLERDLRDRADRLEWRLDHPLDAMFGRQRKGDKQ